MSNPNAHGSELEINGNGLVANLNTHQKQVPEEAQKIALKDAQNKNMGVMRNFTENSSVLEEKANVYSAKVDASLRTVPDCPPNRFPNTSGSLALPHPQNTIRSHDISFGLPPASSSMTVSCATPSVPVSLIKPANPRTSIESNHRDYIQRLISMTPTELSKHAVELENRSMQITRAANREFHRKAELNINLAQLQSRREPGASNLTK